MSRDWASDKQGVFSAVAPYTGMGDAGRAAGGLSFGTVTPNELGECLKQLAACMRFIWANFQCKQTPQCVHPCCHLNPQPQPSAQPSDCSCGGARGC